MRYLQIFLMCSLFGVNGCGEGVEEEPLVIHTSRSTLSIAEVAAVRCDTPPELVEGLSRQLVEAINCIRPGTLADIPLGGDLRMLREGRPAYVDARGLNDLLNAASAGDRQMVVRWSYRDVALQHLFWLQDDFRNCAVAAPAGLSNHQNGLAVDLNDYQYWQPRMRAGGWENNLPNDRVHFDFSGAEDIGLGALSLLAFQHLWNRNHPDEALALTAELDGDTYTALSEAPIEGFELALCGAGAPPVGPGPVRGPTVGQSAWRGCDASSTLIEGLSDQIARAVNCIEPGALTPLRVCRGGGCLNIQAPPIPEWLGTEAHESLLDMSRDFDEPITVRWVFRDIAIQHFFATAGDNIGCPRASSAGRSDLNSGQSAWLPNYAEFDDALEQEGWTNLGSDLDSIWQFDAEDLTNTNVLAFQRLWNLNRPDDPIDTDGLIGPQTRGAIDRAPVAGFALDLCDRPRPPAQDMGTSPPQDAGNQVRDFGQPAPRRDAGTPRPDAAQPGPPRPDRDAQTRPNPDTSAPFDNGRRPDTGTSPMATPPGPEPKDDGCDCEQAPSAPFVPLFLLLFLWRRRVLG